MRLSFKKQHGFTLIEMLVATLIMLIGLVAAAQLVPFAIQLNTANRYDSTALVIAQREMEGMLNQPLSATAFTDPQGLLCPVGSTCNLGNPATPNQVVGSPVVMVNGLHMIDFIAWQLTTYIFIHPDPNDPSAVT